MNSNLAVTVGLLKASYDYARIEATLYATQTICYKVCLCVPKICYYDEYVWVGTPEVCNYKSFFSMQEVTGASTILDPNGLVSYISIAYA